MNRAPADASAAPERRRASAMRITIRAGGPYVVAGGVPLRDADGRSVPTGPAYLLCRCGRSSTKPFCDDTHERVGFEGVETADLGSIAPRRTAYEGTEVTILDARRLCAHAGVCTANLPRVFDVTRPRWIDPDAASSERIADVVGRCPSGALAHALPGGEPVEPELEPGIRCWPGAAYIVTGAIEIVSAGGGAYEPRSRVTLCRCGASRNQPFCDGGHEAVDLGD